MKMNKLKLWIGIIFVTISGYGQTGSGATKSGTVEVLSDSSLKLNNNDVHIKDDNRGTGAASPDIKVSFGKQALLDTVQAAIKTHPSIALAASSVFEASSNIQIARAGYFPSISLAYSSGAIDRSGDAQVATLSATQLLYDFGKVSGLKSQSIHSLAQQEALFLQEVDDIVLDAAEAHIQVHRYQSIVAIAKQQVGAVSKVYKISRIRASSGVDSKTGVVQAQTRVEGAVANLELVKSQLAQWRERLKSFVGRALPMKVDGVPTDILLSSAQTTTDYQNIPRVVASREFREIAQAERDFTRANRMPTISLEARYEEVIDGSYSENFPDNNQASAMITVSMPLYQGGALSASITAAQRRVRSASADLARVLLDVKEREWQLRQEIDGEIRRRDVLQSRTKTIFKTRDLYWDQYTVGARSILDLLNAEQETYQAMNEEEDSLHDLWLARVQLLHVTARLRKVMGLENTVVYGLRIRS